MTAPLFNDETERLEVLRRFDILDMAPEQAFDDLTCLAAQICGTPIALVTLADESRHWAASKTGTDLPEVRRDIAFCEYAMHEPGPLVVPDTRADERFAAHPFVVSEPYVRFYAGVPLRTPEGFALGTLCVMDTVPRVLTQAQTDALLTLGRQVVAQMQLRRHASAREQDVVHARQALREESAVRGLFMESAMGGMVAFDLQRRFTLVNRRMCEIAGRSQADLIGRPFADLQSPEAIANLADTFGRIITERTPVEGLETRLLRPDGTTVSIAFNAAPIVRDGVIVGVAATAEDITERKRAEDALRESEARYRALAENAFDLVCELDGEGRFVYVSPNFKSVLGYSSPELIGRVAFELIHPDDHERVAQEYAGAIADPASGTISFRFRRSDTTWAWLDASANIYRNEAGESRAVIVSRDIGERMAMEATLRESEARLGSFVRNAPLILFATDREGVYTLYEGQGLERLGLRPGHYVGGSTFKVHARYPEVVDGARRALAGEEVTYQFRGPHAALEVHQSPVRDEQGEVTGTIGLVIDVTDRINAVEALQRSEERYRGMFETHGAVRFLVDPATGLIEDANRAACDFYGYSAEEMAGKRISEINILPHEEILEEMRRVRDENQTLFQFKHRLKSGEVRDVDVYTGPVEVDGRGLLFSIVQDVTDRRRAESLLAAQGRLLEMIVVGTPLEDVLETLARTIEEHADGALCSVLLLSRDGKRLRHAAAPSLPDAYNQAIDGIEIGPGVGSCGTAAYRREEVVVEDIAVDPLWADFRDLALSHGLRSCWSTPIFSGAGDALGTFAVYYRETGGVRGRDRELVEIATHLAGIAIERERAEKAMRGRAAELERMYGRLAAANTELEKSNTRIEEESALLEQALELERERSRRDQLTGTLNHAAITDVLREAIDDANTGTLAIAMVDVDELKAANDTYGHQVGDAVLVLVAQTLMRDGAAVGRYGGDEFVAILRGADQRTADAYRDNVLASLAGATLTDPQTGAHVPLVVSMGLAVYPEEGESADDLIRLSDSAMYASRRQEVAGGAGMRSRRPDGASAAELVGELVPYLTSPGDLDQKLRLVAQRLSTGNGYDAVTFAVHDEVPGGPARANVYADTPRDITEAWTADQRSAGDPHPMRLLLDRTHRPVIIDDMQTSDLITPVQKELLAAAGLTSGLVAPMIWRGQVVGMLSVGSKQPAVFGPRDAQFLLTIASQVTAIIRMSTLVDELQTSTSRLREAHEGTVLMLASAAEAHDRTTGRHLQRVRAITEALARELGYNDDDVSALGMAATLHDIGKIRVPDSVLGSSNSLEETEWVLMKQHTLWGSAFLAGQPGFELAASVARHHHERWDGGGYPDGLAGDEIPESALITTIADSFDAMTNNRPYRRSRPVEEAVREIVACSGTQFSPRLVDALVRLFERGDLDFVQPDEDELHRAA